MAELITLKATARPRAGKGAARQARRNGNVPAVIYGNHETPETINLEYNELWKQVLRGHFTSTAIEIDVEGTKHIVLARDVQVDPVRDTPLHVDFQRVGKDGVIRVSIPVHFTNETLSPGLKRGGVLNIVRHDVEEQRGERDGQEIVLRRTTIEEVEVRPAQPPRRPAQSREDQA